MLRISIVCLCALFLFGDTAVSSCMIQRDRFLVGATAWVSRDPILYEMVYGIVGKAHVAMPRVCEFDNSIDVPHTVLKGRSVGITTIMIPFKYKQEVSQTALRGVIAHEVAHIVRGVLRDRATRPEYDNEERLVDHLASTWVGTETMRKGLLETRAFLAKRYHFISTVSINAELTARIIRLEQTK